MLVRGFDPVKPQPAEEWLSGHGGRFSLTYEPEVDVNLSWLDIMAALIAVGIWLIFLFGTNVAG